MFICEERTVTVAQISANVTDEVKICYMKTTASFGKSLYQTIFAPSSFDLMIDSKQFAWLYRMFIVYNHVSNAFPQVQFFLSCKEISHFFFHDYVRQTITTSYDAAR